MTPLFPAEQIPAKIRQLLDDAAGEWYALLQGYPFTGFARILPGGVIQIAPAHERTLKGAPIPWRLFFDVRLFKDDFEWHAWRLGDGQWAAREAPAKPPEDKCEIEREYPLKGHLDDAAEGTWRLYKEGGRGHNIWVPEKVAGPKKLGLRVVQILGPSIDDGNRDWFAKDLLEKLVPLITVVDARIAKFIPIAEE